MVRDLSVERLYSLGDFKNIKFNNVLRDIPEHLALDEKVIALLYYQQVLACETAYRKYYELVSKLSKDKLEEVLKELEAEREKTFAELSVEIDRANAAKVNNDYGKK